jgi:hypothetical protein
MTGRIKPTKNNTVFRSTCKGALSVIMESNLISRDSTPATLIKLTHPELIFETELN